MMLVKMTMIFLKILILLRKRGDICIVEEGEIYSILLRKIYSMPHV